MSPAEEEDEVRSLLTRHQSRILSDMMTTDLLAVLVKNSVISADEEEVLSKPISVSAVNVQKSSDTGSISGNESCSGSGGSCNDSQEVLFKIKCANLINLIAQNGFEKFKQFCYAVENECPQLIEDLINDRLKCGTYHLCSSSTYETNTTNDDENVSLNEEKVKKDENESSGEKDKDYDRSRRAASYGPATNTSTIPKAAPRRVSLMKEPPPPPPPHLKHHLNDDVYKIEPAPSPPIVSKFPQAEYNFISHKLEETLMNQQNNFYQSPSTVSSNYSSLLCHASSTASPNVVRKRDKLLHRFSDAATLGRKLKKKKINNRTCHSMTEAIEMLADPVIEDEFFADRTTWEYHTVGVTRVPGYGFGIAVSGGRDNPHFANGDPSIAVSDVLKGGPAEDRLQVNDRIITVNGVSLENVEYATAVQVLRDSGNTVKLVVKRRVALPPVINHQHTHSLSSIGQQMMNNPPGTISISPTTSNNNVVPGQPIKVTLSKTNKKEDFGIVLGCRLFVKEISSKARDQLAANGYSLQEGDIISRIQNTNCNDQMTMKEAKKIIDSCKDRLNLVVLRDITNSPILPNNLNNANIYSTTHSQQVSSCSNNLDDPYLNGGTYASQNLYVQPPTRNSAMCDEKSNLTPRGRSRGPITDLSLQQLDRPTTPPGGRRVLDDPPRPPPPRVSGTGEDFYGSRRQLYDDDPIQKTRQSAEPRFISFQKEGSVGIRLTGGNEAGIFVTAVQPGSPASLQGLTPGDKILKVNDMDMNGVTREEAVLFLLSLQDRIDLIVQHCKEEYDETVANQRGDSFHIKTHFHCDNPSKGEMSFKAGDCFRVTDTLHNGVVGSWQVQKIGRGHQEMQRGVIPNKSRAEEMATAQFNATKKEMNASESRGNFFRRRRSTHRRSKSLSRENWDDVVFSDSISKFPAYERVVLRHPGFVRPIVLFGPVADLAREKLTKDFADKYTEPLQDGDDKSAKCRIVRLSNIRDIMDRGKHALLDITPNAVDRLNYAQFYPIVIFLKAENKHVIKSLRQGIPKSAHKSSKKLLEQCQKLDRVWSHIFSTTIVLSEGEGWYRKLRDAIDLQQSGAVWMSENKPAESLSDDFLFPMSSSRLSYASSPESDLEMSPGPPTSLSLGNLPQLVKSSSDPSIATNQDNLEILGEGLPPPYTQQFDGSNRGSKYLDTSTGRPQSLYGIHAPDLPPRIDRQSKPSGTPSRTSSSGGTLGRSAQERLFGKSSSIEANDHDEYVTRKPNTDSMERIQAMAPPGQNSLDRARALANSTYQSSPQKGGIPGQNGSYDSVSSYDSYNNSQSMRLGPNAPDDLNGRMPPPSTNPDYRSVHHSRGFSASNDLNRQNSPGRPQYDVTVPRNIDPRQRPSNLMLDSSPRKPLVETKTDYGKYSRNNSASTADYTKVPKHGVVPIPNINGNGNTPPVNGNMPFKPVPPPKPKNYRPPVQGQWENGEPSSPRSPNGFYYPPTPSHYHHSQATISNGNGLGPTHHPPIHAYGSPAQQHAYPPNGYNGNGPNGYSGNAQYMQRGPPPIASLPPDRHALDLAGSREQRGSAFELYRKPQIGATGHHHNMSDMEPYGTYYNTPPQQQVMYVHSQDPNYSHFYANGQGPPPLPMKNTFPKVKKKSVLKTQLTAIKNAFIKTTKPLRRMNSMVEPERKLKPILKRQHSMMERHMGRLEYPNEIHTYPRQMPPQEPIYSRQPYQRNDQYYPQDQQHQHDLNSTYTNLEPNDIYGSTDKRVQYQSQNLDDIYSNRASIDLERRQQGGGRRIVRRHSLADRSGARRQQYVQHQEDIYQSRQGAYMVEPRRMAPNSEVMQRRRFYAESEPHSPTTEEPIYTTRREMHRNHLYQSRKEMQDRIAAGKNTAEREFSPQTSSSHSSGGDDRSDKENSSCRSDKDIYQSRREMRLLREQIYQTRRDAMESMAEPTYVSKRDLSGRPEPIYESKEERANEADESKLPCSSAEETLSNSKHSNETMIETTVRPKQPDEATDNNRPPILSTTSAVVHESPVEEEDEEEDESVLAPLPTRPSPFHISNMIKRTAPPPLTTPPVASSRTSLETQYTSQASLGVGPPNATSTPYASDLSLPLAPPVRKQAIPLRDTITTTGVFDEKGGTLCDGEWNVSLVIPPGAIPSGVKQEIYFTVSDPRLGQAAAGAPPLDMENGETMLSPLVMCGPQGLEFAVPVTLNIPHCAGKTASLGLSLKATDSEKNLHTQWDNIDLPSNTAAHTVSVKVDHF